MITERHRIWFAIVAYFKTISIAQHCHKQLLNDKTYYHHESAVKRWQLRYYLALFEGRESILTA